MWRIGRALAILAIGWSLLLAPAAVADPAPLQPTEVVSAQPPPGPDLQNDSEQGPPSRDRIMVGVAGVVLILLVLATRRMRKKPVLFFRWKKK